MMYRETCTNMCQSDCFIFKTSEDNKDKKLHIYHTSSLNGTSTLNGSAAVLSTTFFQKPLSEPMGEARDMSRTPEKK